MVVQRRHLEDAFAFAEALFGVFEVSHLNHHREVLHKEYCTQQRNEQLFADDVKSIEAIEKTITEKLRSTLGIGAKVHLVNPKSIQRSEGKAKRVIDKRKL